jgi:hypothetical protein
MINSKKGEPNEEPPMLVYLNYLPLIYRLRWISAQEQHKSSRQRWGTKQWAD